VGLFTWGALSDKRADLSFKIVRGSRQRSHIYRGQNRCYMSSIFSILHVGQNHWFFFVCFFLEKALYKGPNGFHPLVTYGRKQIRFPKRRVFYFLEYRTMEKVHKPSNSDCYTPPTELFRIYVHMSAFYICQGPLSLRTPAIYSFACNSSIYVRTVYEYTRPDMAHHALIHVAHVTTAT
jgi:hypothetical protein